MQLKSVSSLSTHLIMYVGLIFNLAYVIHRYMKFETMTNEASSTPGLLNSPRVSLCYDMLTLLSDKGQNISERTFIKNVRNQSMGEIFSMTPSPSKSLSHCSYRDFTRDIMIEEHDGSKCADKLNVTRHRMHNFICYSYNLAYDDKKYNFHQVTRSLNSPKLLASLTVNFPLNTGHSVYPLVSSLYEKPIEDRVFNQPLYPSKTHNQLFKLDYHEFETTRLPAPYDTNCVVGMSSAYCYFCCMNDFYSANNLVAISSFSDERNQTNYLLFPVYDDPLDGAKMSKLFDSSHSICSARCTKPSCYEVLSKTFVSLALTNNFKLTFEIETIKYPTTRIVHSPKYHLPRFLTESITLLTIWINFSFCAFIMMIHLPYQLRHKQVITLENERHKLVRNIRSTFPISSLIIPHDLLDHSKSSRLSVKKCSSLCLIVLSLIGLSIQLYNLLYSYFQFKVDYSATHNFDPDIDYPSLTLCLDVQFIFNKPNILDVAKETFEKEYETLDVTGNYSLNDMYDQAAEILPIKSCALRNLSNYSFIKYDSKQQCEDKFNHSLLYLDSYMCHRFKPKQRKIFPASSIRFFSSELPGVIYILEIDTSRLENLSRVMAILDYSDLPYHSQQFGSYAFIPRRARTFFVSCSIQSISYLPFPYETNCIPAEASTNCLSDCLQKKITERFDRLPVQQMILKRSSLKLISFRDLYQESTYSRWQKIQDECRNQCFQLPCEYNSTQTQVFPTHGNEYQLAFAVDIPSLPKSITLTVPRQNVYGLSYNIICSISFWTGFSFLLFVPVSKKLKHESTIIMNLHLKCEYLIKFIASITSKSNINHRWSYFQWFQNVYHVLDVRSRFIYLLCVTGCSAHLTWALADYLRYPTIMNIDLYNEDSTNYSLSICIESGNFIHNFRSNMRRLTEIELFHQTPDIHVIQSCSMRGLGQLHPQVSDKILFHYMNATECHLLFRVIKFVLDTNICYHFMPIHHSISLENNLNLPRCLYSLSLNSSLLSKRYRLAMNAGHRKPRITINWAARVMKMSDDINAYLVTYRKYNQALVPYPYDDNGMTGAIVSYCIDSCGENFFFHRNRTAIHARNPLSKFTFFPPQEDTQTVNFPLLFSNCYQSCKRQAYSWSGDYLFFTTKVESTAPIIYDDKSITTTFFVLTTDLPVERMQLTPAHTMIDLIITCGSILGLWFGFSVKSIDPGVSSRSYVGILLMKQKLDKAKDQLNSNAANSRRVRTFVSRFSDDYWTSR